MKIKIESLKEAGYALGKQKYYVNVLNPHNNKRCNGMAYVLYDPAESAEGDTHNLSPNTDLLVEVIDPRPDHSGRAQLWVSAREVTFLNHVSPHVIVPKIK